MGLLSTFFVASEPEARVFSVNSVLPPEDVLESGGIHVFHLALLQGVLLKSIPSTPISEDFPLVSDPEDQNSWTFSISPSLQDGLIRASDTQLRRAAAEWITTEDMEGCTLDVAMRLINDLRRLALRARETGRTMYLWVAL